MGQLDRILQFSHIPYCPDTLPDEDMLQITQLDAEAFARQETNRQKHSRKHAIKLDLKHTGGSDI